jgi:hypothetical protein
LDFGNYDASWRFVAFSKSRLKVVIESLKLSNLKYKFVPTHSFGVIVSML